MKQDIVIPSPGESVSEGVLAKWLIPSGSPVAEGDELFEFETDKATLAVPATHAGVLTHAVEEGADVEVGQVVATIDTDAAATAEAPAPGDAPPAGAPEGVDAAPQPTLSPAVRKLVQESGIDVSTVTGTGKNGRILKKDVEAAVAARAPAAPAAPAAAEVPAPAPAPVTAPRPPAAPAADGDRTRREPMTSIRKRIAQNLVESKHSAAHLTTFNEIDMSAIMQLRKTYGEAFEKQHGVRLGFMSLFVKSVCQALQAVPGVNAMIDGEDIVYHDYGNIGIAVSTEKGLVVPVLRDAQAMSLAQIETQIRGFAEQARGRSLSVDDLVGGNFTITNGGVFGSLLSTPIPTPSQTAILGMHTIQKRPVAVGDNIEIRPMMYVALTYDHRVIDGQEAVTFLVKVKQGVEAPQTLLLDL